ncbi:MAG TPA: hypothetical protein VG603_16565 [Chitinophagales bacterium]|nr:hypothetical protein [Chitinophagales bacterium]
MNHPDSGRQQDKGKDATTPDAEAIASASTSNDSCWNFQSS